MVKKFSSLKCGSVSTHSTDYNAAICRSMVHKYAFIHRHITASFDVPCVKCNKNFNAKNPSKEISTSLYPTFKIIFPELGVLTYMYSYISNHYFIYI